MSNKQKYALITGATSGIGYELAKLFAKDNYNLIIVARNSDDLQKTSSELIKDYGIEVTSISKDLIQRDGAFEVYNDVKTKGINVDVLVNNAAQGQFGEFIDTDIYRELDIIQLNICSYVVLTKCFLKDMIARNEGRILNVSSIAGKLPGPWQSVYHGTKAFVQSFSESVRSEIKDSNVTITTLLPGATDTDFFNKADMQDSKITESGLADPAVVAADGYKALMEGDDMVVSGAKNKAMVGASNFVPDHLVADVMKKQQEPKGM